MNTTRIYLVRHGATLEVAEDRFSGALDVPLSDEGRAQARALGARLLDQQISAVYASPMSRTSETARLVSHGWHLDVKPVDGLREIGHGRWEGLRRRDVEARFASEFVMWEQDPFTFAPEGGESGASVLARALPAVRTIVQAHPDQRVLVVSHKATIRLILCGLLGIDARGYRDRLDQEPACLNVIDFRDPVRARLVLFNDTSHYLSCPPAARPHLSNWFG
jgi:broad specificity phosphatase PhoE